MSRVGIATRVDQAWSNENIVEVSGQRPRVVGLALDGAGPFKPLGAAWARRT